LYVGTVFDIAGVILFAAAVALHLLTTRARVS
jgi:hypothetical protein